MARKAQASIATEKTESTPEVATAQGRYAQLQTDREPYLTRGREAAALTIPSLMPPEGSTGQTKLIQPWQSLGAKGVNNLSSKIALILFPPGGSFFRLTVDDFTLSKLMGDADAGGDSGKDVRAEIEEAFGKVERAVATRLEERGARMQLSEAARQLIVVGNALLQVLPDEALKLHKFDKYCVKRDATGNVTEIVVRESVDRTTLSEEIQALIKNNPATDKTTGGSKTDVDIYTWVRRVGKKWVTTQEVNGLDIPSSAGTYPLDKSPWIPIRLISVDGEDYGRGFVEEVIGDLGSYDSLRQAIIEGSAISSRMIPLVNEGGVTSIKDLTEARNGQPIQGNVNDIKFLQVEKFADLRVAFETSTDIKRDLQQSFLLLSGATRDAERVTAEEIRLMAQELEIPLGGSYPVLSQELQRPLVSRLMFQMQRKKQLPTLPEKTISLQIVTGMAGLGRHSDLNKLDLLLGGASEIFGPEVVNEYCSAGAYLKRRATALAIDVTGIVRSDEDVAQSRAQAQKAELAQSAIGPAAKLAGDQMAAQQTATPQ